VTTTLLIDGDILVFQIASACQKSTDWGDGNYSVTADLKEAKGRFRDKVAELKLTSCAGEVKIALKGEGNFRREILPTYKANRNGVVPPMLRQPLMDWLLKSPQVVSRPGLEGDDVLGILATDRKTGEADPNKIIWSIDKDMRQIPGSHWDGASGITEIDTKQADLYHMFQTLTGDSTDGYKGLPGCGPVKAARILEDGPYHWTQVVGAYIFAGLTEADALVQARVARILRATDYNYTERKPILWTPIRS